MLIYIYVCICMNSYFMQFYSTVNALTYLTDQTRNKVHSSDYACEIDVDFIRAFDTVHQILLQKKKKDIRFTNISNKWYTSYSCIRKQFVSINGCNSSLTDAS